MPAILVFCGTLLTYLLTTAHSVTFEDSGIFISAAASLGLPQPPGYPLYTSLAWLFTHIPISTVAFRVHLLSAFCGAGAALFYFLSVRKIFQNVWVAVIAAILLATADTFWAQAIVAEVYTLHIFLFSLLFYLSLRIAEAPTTRNFVYFGIVFGLSLANHWPLLLLASPIFLCFAWAQRREVLIQLKVWLPVALGVAGIFYFWMMWRSQQNPAVSFLGPINSVGDLWDYIARQYYGNINGQADSSFIDRLYFLGDALFGFFWREWLFVGTWLLPLGFYVARKYFSKPQVIGLGVTFLSTTVFLQLLVQLEFNSLNQNVMRVFHIVPIFSGALIMAAAADFLINRFGSKILAVIISGLLVVYVHHYLRNDLRTDTFAEDYARLVVDAIPVREHSQALIAGVDADIGPLAYVNIALGQRPDLSLYTEMGGFFRNQIHEPFLRDRRVRYEKILSFIKNQGHPVYSTKVVDVFDGVKSLPVENHFNGLFYELAVSPQQLEIPSAFVDRAVAQLDKYILNSHSANWSYHRDVIAARFCGFLVLRNVQHEAFAKSPACKNVYAQHLMRTKKYEEADGLFRELIADSGMMIGAERHILRFYQLLNRIDWINSESSGAEVGKIKEALDFALPGLSDYKRCGNAVATVFEAMKGQVPWSSEVERAMTFFKGCKRP